MKTGTMVRLVQPEIQGRIVERRINTDTDEIEVLVEWNEDGSVVRRWLDADRLEPITAEEPTP